MFCEEDCAVPERDESEMVIMEQLPRQDSGSETLQEDPLKNFPNR